MQVIHQKLLLLQVDGIQILHNQHLIVHINTYGIIAGFLFKGKGNNPISPTWVRKQFRKLLIKCGYSEDFCRVHDLRGQYVDIMKAVGTPTSQIAKEVGHTRTSTTDDIYTEILAEVPKESIRKINAIFS